MQQISVKDCKHFFFNGLRLIPCKCLDMDLAFIGHSVIKCHLSRYPIVVEDEFIYPRDSERLDISYNVKNGWSVKIKEGVK